LSARDNGLFASSQFCARVGAQRSRSFVGEATGFSGILNNAIAEETGGVSGIVIGSVAQIYIGAAKQIDVF